jgi:signal transduction histidine kinase
MSTSVPLRTRRAYERASWPARARSWTRALCAALVILCGLVVAGWYLHAAGVMRLGDTMMSTKLNGALAVGAVAGGHLCRRPAVRLALFGFGGAVGLAVLAEYAFDVDLGIDQLLVRDDTTLEGRVPGRPAEASATCLVLLSLAGFAIDAGRRKAAQWLAGAPLVVGMIAVYGYLYGIDSFYQVGPFSSMSVMTAVALVVLSFATWLAVPGGVLQWVCFGDDTGAALQRMLLPVALVLLPFAGWVHLWSERGHHVSQPLAAALLMTFVAVVVTFAGYLVGRTALRMDTERDTLLDELHRVNASLEDRVRGKALQLNRQKTKLALFEERDRIARDLHDRVIQRIFAAGLQVASISRTARKEATEHGAVESPVADNLNTVATELDLAIRELRNSIFELTSMGDHDNVDQVVRDIAARASRILGFSPRVEVSGAVAGLSPDLVAQLASVIQEGLSNVARHARANAVEVRVEATEDDLQVRIADDGVGLPDPLPRSSGITNMMSRARNLGGTATWGDNTPSGTVLLWRVPKDIEAVQRERTGFGLIDRVLDGAVTES